MKKPPWRIRRRIIFATLGLCWAKLIYVAARFDSTPLAETLALGAFGLIGAVVSSYVFGAAYEDVRHYRKGGDDGLETGRD